MDTLCPVCKKEIMFDRIEINFGADLRTTKLYIAYCYEDCVIEFSVSFEELKQKINNLAMQP